MKSFIVVTDSPIRPIDVELRQAESLEALANELIGYDGVVEQMEADGESVKCSAVEMLLDFQSDGCDVSYTIKELVDGKLIDTIIKPDVGYTIK